MATIDNSLVTSLNGLGATSESAKKDRNSLGQTEFLELMITQLKTQDPFEPMENGDFIAQMAQFSSVTGLAELQQSFDKLATSLQSNQALQASSLVGRTVLVPTNVGTLPVDGPMSGAIDLPEASNMVSLTIQDGSGQVVRRLELGSHASGEVYFNWDGLTDGATPAQAGRYYITASAEINGEAVALEPLVNASVASVTLGQGGQGLTLNLTDGNIVDFASVKEIK